MFMESKTGIQGLMLYGVSTIKMQSIQKYINLKLDPYDPTYLTSWNLACFHSDGKVTTQNALDRSGVTYF